MSISEGCFPDEMKIAKVLPLFKAGNNRIVTNYRPISILPLFSKILYNRLILFINANNILYDYQFGFRR